MAVFFPIFKRFSTHVFQLGRRNSCHLFKSTFESSYSLHRSLVVGPRKLTFGKKTDLELLMKHMKLGRHDKFLELLPSTYCAELLANHCEDMDYKMVRRREPFFLNYRVDLLRQRVLFMEEMKLTPLQKRREIERHPPVLMLSFAPGEFSVHYLRGLIHCGGQTNGDYKFVHFLYQCRPKLNRSYSFEIETNLGFICKELGITNECALKMTINMPSFLLWNINMATEEFRVIHRDNGLPLGYNIDFHTAPIYPPMAKSSFELKHGVLTNRPSPQLVDELELFLMSDILEYKFSLPQEKPEDLSRFLIDSSRAEGVNENAELL